jgi:putative GTP pyrophosphokinase
MKYPSVPTESKSKINKAGAILSGRTPGSMEEFKWAIDLVSRWRACHAYPINTFQSTLRTKLKDGGYKHYIVAQRLKRLPTIIDKLKRFNAMQVSTMQDIGGLRAVLPTIDSCYKIRNEYMMGNHFSKMLLEKDVKDYIQKPRDDDGYRGLHLIFKYQNSLIKDFDGLKIEMQFRTKLQHAWATAVESMGTFLGQSLKSRQGDESWLKFFSLISSSFAFKENTTPIPKYSHLTEIETHEKIQALNKKLGALDKLIGLSAVMRVRQNAGKGSTYYLLILDSLNHTIEIRSYGRNDFFKASDDYSEIELKVNQGQVQVEPVLVSSESLGKLKRAYPNFFLDTTDFLKELRPVLQSTESRKLLYKEMKKRK